MFPDTPQKSVVGFSTVTLPTILIVDDDALVVKAMQNLLGREGFATIGCMNGADAMSKCVVGISAAIVDIHLPDVSGLTLSQHLRTKLGPTTPIIILSGDTSMDTIRALPEAKATYFCSKPVNTGILIGQLKDLLGIQPAG